MSSVPNYRQEIRGLLRNDPTSLTSSKPECSNTLISGIKPDIIQSVVSSSSSSSSQQQQKAALNRLSRVVHPQLHQQHIKNLWKHYLYELQQRAPTPKRVVCPFVIRSRPSYYGREFHGIMSRLEAEQILLEKDDNNPTGGDDGRYLIRESSRQKSQMTLSLRFNGQTKNFRLFYLNGKHFVNEMKKFDTVHDLVADGLITLFVELHASDYIANLTNECRYEESPYMTLHKDRLLMQRQQQQRQPHPSSSSSSSSQRSSAILVNTHHNQDNLMIKTSSQHNRRSLCQLDDSKINNNNKNVIQLISASDLEPQNYPVSSVDMMTINDNSTTTTSTSTSSSLTSAFDIKLLEKSHNFKQHTFIGHPWCDYCGNFIWGLIGQGVRCEDCGFGAHRKCSELVPNDCCPDLRHIRRIFGIDLTTFCKASNSLRPFIVEQCILEIERRGLRSEGLYRTCGSNDEIESLKNRFENEWEQTRLDQIEDINVISGLLKLYLRLLPIPLITFESYQYFIDAAKKSSQDQAINGLREAANTHLPPAHYQTLKFLIIHLNKVCAFEDYNLMSAKNLSLIFGQTLIYTPNIPVMFQMNCWEIESKTIELMILFWDKIFTK